MTMTDILTHQESASDTEEHSRSNLPIAVLFLFGLILIMAYKYWTDISTLRASLSEAATPIRIFQPGPLIDEAFALGFRSDDMKPVIDAAISEAASRGYVVLAPGSDAILALPPQLRFSLREFLPPDRLVPPGQTSTPATGAPRP